MVADPGAPDIPPVRVPKDASNGHGLDESEGAVIPTPPGSGEDVHGDPKLRSEN